MFLFFARFQPKCSYKLGSNKKKRVTGVYCINPLSANVGYTFFYKNKVYKNIRLQWQKKLKHAKNILRLWEGLQKKNVVFILKLWWGISTNIKIVLTIYMIVDVNKKNEVQFEFFSKIMRHAKESLHLENKNMLRTFLGLKLKKIRTSEGFL